ncbi:hypothetical protein JW711_05900 [Candidatus Woesearchaeota archaeon]|nr:hypothetical protein [Candidatus Woesearchaeota archaeon]
MEEDISNKTIVVLVLLTVIISVLSTLVVISEISSLRVDDGSGRSDFSGSTSGQVSLEIVKAAEPSSATGHVTLMINPKE